MIRVRPCFDDDFVQRVDHFVHQNWNVATICEDPQLDAGPVVSSIVFRGDLIRARFVCVEPHDELLENSRLLGIEFDDTALGFRKVPIEGSFEVSGVESEQAAVDVEGSFACASANLNGDYLANVHRSTSTSAKHFKSNKPDGQLAVVVPTVEGSCHVLKGETRSF